MSQTADQQQKFRIEMMTSTSDSDNQLSRFLRASGVDKCAFFARFAGSNRETWMRIVGAEVEHATLGIGTFTDARYEGIPGRLFVFVLFPDESPYQLAVERCFAPSAFIPAEKTYFTDLKIPSSLVYEIDEYLERAALESELRRQEHERQEARRHLVRVFVQLCRAATRGDTDIGIPVDKFEVVQQDLELVLAWANTRMDLDTHDIESAKRAFLAHAVSQGRETKFATLLSARVAERAASHFFESLGYPVQDIAATQLANPTGGDWTDFDLRVAGRKIDVKNARYFPHFHGQFPDHRVQRPEKSVWAGEKDVRIAAVMSPYLRLPHLLFPNETPESYKCRDIFVLGTTRPELAQELNAEFAIPGRLELEFRRANDAASMYLPHWMFDYPLNFYAKREDVLKEFASTQWPEDLSPLDERELSLTPCLIAAGVTVEGLRRHTSGWAQSDMKLIGKLIVSRERHGLSLPFIYLSLLWHFVQIGQDLSVQERPADYRKILFWDTTAEVQRWPLFVYDPKETVFSLAKALDTLWTKRNDMIREFRQYRLRAAGILRARTGVSDNWRTLFAYCGNCGQGPLVWGEDENCQECGRLICSCGFCSQGCSQWRRHPKFRQRHEPEGDE